MNIDHWYKSAFTRDYLQIYSHRDSAEAEEDLKQLLTHLNLPAHPLCLDLGCGFGRHLAYLNERGITTIGFDLSRDLIEYGQAQWPNLRLVMVQADMRQIPFRAAFDFVFSFFTSFGYFLDDSENLQVLLEMARVLKPQGGFVIDYLNSTQIRQDLIANDQRHLIDMSIIQNRRINHAHHMIEKEIIIRDAGGERSHWERIKLYQLADFEMMCDQAGLVITRTYGDYSGGEVEENSPRLIMIGEKR